MNVIKSTFTCLAALILGGCAAPSAPAVPVASTPAVPHRQLQETHTEGQNSAAMWALNFLEDQDHSWCGPIYNGSYWTGGCYTWHVTNYTTTGAGKIEYLGNGRIHYQVPDGQALHITEIAGTTAPSTASASAPR